MDLHVAFNEMERYLLETLYPTNGLRCSVCFIVCLQWLVSSMNFLKFLSLVTFMSSGTRSRQNDSCVLRSFINKTVIYSCLRYYLLHTWAGRGGGRGSGPPLFGPRYRLFNIGPKVGPPLFLLVDLRLTPPPLSKILDPPLTYQSIP